MQMTKNRSTKAFRREQINESKTREQRKMAKAAGNKNKFLGRIIGAVKPRREEEEAAANAHPLELTFQRTRDGNEANNASRPAVAQGDHHVTGHDEYDCYPTVPLGLEPQGERVPDQSEFALNFDRPNPRLDYPPGARMTQSRPNNHLQQLPPRDEIAFTQTRGPGPHDSNQRLRTTQAFWNHRKPMQTQRWHPAVGDGAQVTEMEEQRPPGTISVKDPRLVSISSMVSELTLDQDLRKMGFAGDGEPQSFRRPSLVRRLSDSDLENLQDLQQILEVFPNADRSHAAQLLKRRSIRTAMIVLAEESLNNEEDFHLDMSCRSAATPSSLPVDNDAYDPATGGYRDVGIPVDSANPGRGPSVEYISSPAPTDDDKPSGVIRGPSVEYVPTPVQSDDRKPSGVMRRSNSFSSMAEFEGDVKGLDAVMEIFPEAEQGRSKYLLRQYSLSTVLMILASES